jgi:FMN-dependent oxidoreductase (nitrilotriacetate monooxygenase family)
MPAKAMMKLAAFSHPPGVHRAGWRHPQAAPDGDMDFAQYAHLAQKAEQGKMDTVFFQDSLSVSNTIGIKKRSKARGQMAMCVCLEPGSVLPALAVMTKNIGLIATMTTTYNDPFTVARRFSTIDHISGGRAGWNLVTSQVEDESWNFGFEKHLEHAVRYERASEFYDVVTGLWDTWDDDAIVRDKKAGVYFDVDKVHFLNHKGRFFNVRGPLNSPRSPQGHPVIAQAGSSDAGRELAARTAEIIFTAQSNMNEAKAFLSDVKGRADKYGRTPDDIKILPGVMPVVGRTDAEAQEKNAELQSYITDEMCIIALQRHTGGVDLTKYPIDGPLPELLPSNAAKARQDIIVAMGKKGMSIREIGRNLSGGAGHSQLIGSPQTIADHLEHWFVNGAADGFTVMFPYVPGSVDDWVDLVIPELQRRGLFRTEYEGPTLRDNLGLKKPASRYVQGHKSEAAE